MIKKSLVILSVIALIFIIGIGFGFIFGNWSLQSKETFETTAGQFVEINQKDEWVIAEMVNNERFIKEEFSTLFDFPYGDSNASISLNAHYKYYIKLSDLHLELNDRTLIIFVPKLHLSMPVAIDYSDVIEKSTNSWLGGDSH